MPDSMSRFLAKIRELVWPRLSADEQALFHHIAAGHAGGHAKAERLRGEGQPKEDAESRKFPYDRLEQLPSGVKNALPEAAQKVWLAAYNSADKQHPDDEGACVSIAWAAVKQAGYHRSDGGWKKGGENDIAIERIVASVEASQMGTYYLLGEVSLAEGGKSIEVQIFPRVGVYQHPRYGELKITPAFLQEVKRNFDAQVYQQQLPLTIDLEHQSSLSGAVGWVSKVDVRGSDGAFATIDLNDRGQELVSKDAYRYFSPEYYDKWIDPASGKEFANILIGGALTNRPFFKGMAPVIVNSEGVFAFAELTAEQEQEVGMTEEEAKRLAETEASVKTLTERLAAEESARKAAEDRAAKLERDANRKELTEEVKAFRLGYRGEVDAAVDRLEALKSKLSDDEFSALIEDHHAMHAQLSESTLLKQVSRPGVQGAGQSDFDQAVHRTMADRKVGQADAIGIVATEQPELYRSYTREHLARAKRGEE